MSAWSDTIEEQSDEIKKLRQELNRLKEENEKMREMLKQAYQAVDSMMGEPGYLWCEIWEEEYNELMGEENK